MKNLKKILIIALILFACVFAAGYIIVVIQGKSIIAGQLENILHRKVNINYAGLTPPLNLEIRGLDITGLAKADYIFISPSIPGLLGGNIVLNELKIANPKIIYEKTPDRTGAVGVAAGVDTITSAYNPQPKSGLKPQSVSGGNKYLRLIIKRLNIKSGAIDFIDHTLPGEGIKITIKDINFNLTNLYIYPRSAITDFEITGRIPWFEGEAEGKFEAKGWVNLFKKDIEAKVNISDIDGVYLYPYYSAWVDLEKTRIQSAKLNLTSDVKGKDNNIAAACHLELTDIVFKQREEEASKAEKIAEVVMGIFKALNKGKIEVNFTIKTKMTNPEFNFGYIKTALEDKFKEGMKYSKVNYADIFKAPVKSVGKTANDLSRAVFNGASGLARVVKDTLKVAFQKEKE